MCILLAEDNEANIRGMGEYLQDRGYDVVVARNGQEALGMAVARRPALILMDIQMPTMDGLEATRRLRGLPEFAATPIIALTALAMPGDRERCLAAGANDYLTKPVSLKGLVETMQQWLGKPE
jgi:CheY-like chemotaxis protein